MSIQGRTYIKVTLTTYTANESELGITFPLEIEISDFILSPIGGEDYNISIRS